MLLAGWLNNLRKQFFGKPSRSKKIKRTREVPTVNTVEVLEDRALLAAISYATAGSSYSQTFDNLLGTVPANNTTVEKATVLPAGWEVAESLANANTMIRIDNGSSGTGDSYLYGATSSNERALGAFSSGSMTVIFGASFINNTGGTLTSFTLKYVGEEWKDGGSSAAIPNVEAFSYSVGATGLSTGSYTNVTALDFTAPVSNTSSDVTLNGNLTANQVAVGGTNGITVSGLTWAAGQTLYIRWSDPNDPGNDDGLAIDNVVFSAAGAGGNQAPTATNLSAAETYTEDTALNLTDIVVSDADSASVTATLTLSNTAAGTLNTGTSNAVTSTYNSGTGIWTASGAIADVNTLLAALTFTPALNFNGNFNISTSVTDGVAAAITGTKAMTGTPVNDVPVATASSVTTNEDTAKTFAVSDFQFTDVESNSLVSITISSLSLASGDSLKLSGTDVTANQTITAANIPNLVYTPALNANGSARSTFSFKVNDAGSGTTAATMTIDVTAVNDVPVATASSVTTNEDTAKTFAATDFQFTDVEGNSLVSITIGSLSLASGDTLKLSGTDVTANQTITAANIPNLVYAPAANANGSARSTFSFKVNDAGSGTTAASMSINVTAVNDAPVGANKAISVAQNGSYVFASADFGFTDPNDSPANSLLAVKITSLPSVGTLTFNGSAVAVNDLIPANGTTSIASGALVFAPVVGGSGAPYATFKFRVRDDGGTTNGGVDLDVNEATITVNVIANQAPVFGSASYTFSLAENSANNTVVDSVSASDPDAGQTVTYSITGGNASGAFKINSTTGEISVNDTTKLDFETTPSFSLTVTATDNASSPLSSNVNVTVNLTNVHEAPTIANQSFTINENLSNGSAVGTVAATADTSLTIASYSITAGNGTGGGAFAIDASGHLTVADATQLDYETLAGHAFTLTVQVTDNGGSPLSSSATVAVNLSNVHEAPTIGTQTFTVAENLANSSAVGTVAATADTGLTIASYSITAGNGTGGGAFAIDNSGNITVADATQLDFETVSGHAFTLTVQATDSAGSPMSSSATVMVNLTNVHEAPTIADQSFTIFENLPNGSAVGTVAATTDTGVSIASYSITGGNGSGGGAFAIDNSGNITVADASQLNYETVAQHKFTLTVQVTDNGGTPLSSSASVTVNLSNLNEAPAGTDAAVSTNKNNDYTFTTANFGFTDPNDSPANVLQAVVITTLPAAGTLKLNGVAVTAGQSIPVASITGSLLKFSPAANAFGSPYTTFTFQVQDDGGVANGGVDLDQSPNTITVNVTNITALGQGGIAFLAMNTAGASPDADWVAFVTLTDIAAGQTIYFTDNEITTVSGTTFNTGESYTKWVAPAGGVAAGTVVKLTDFDNGSIAANVGTVSVVTFAGSTNRGFSATADSVYAYLAASDATADTPTTFLARINVGNAADGVTPTALTTGVIVFTGGEDGAYYSGSRSNQTTYAGYMSLLTNPANWTLVTGVLTKATVPNTSFTLAVTNTAPTATNLSAAETYIEDTPLNLTDIVVSDVENDNVTVTLTLSTTAAGSLNTATSNAVTSTYNAGTGVWSASGAIADVNTLLAGLTFTPASNFNGNFTISTSVSDGVAAAITGSKVMTGTAVNDAPAGTDGSVLTYKNIEYVFSALNFGFTDPIDSPANILAAVKITTLPALGTLTNDGSAVTTGQVIAVADITGGKLKFLPATDEFASPYTTFTFQVQDDGGTTNGGVDLDQTANTLTINVNETPVINHAPAGADKTVTTNEDTTYTFVVGDFGFSDTNDTPANALLAVKITTLPVAGSLTNNNVAVSAGDFIPVADITSGKLKFAPVANANGAGYASFTFQVQDDGGVVLGGVDLDQSPNTITVDVTSVNDVPAGADKTVTTAEDTDYVFTTGDFGFSDTSDTPANALLAVKITTLPVAGTLTNNNVAVAAGDFISAADITGGKLKFTPVANASGATYATFTFQVQDDGTTANGGVDLDQSANTITVSVTSVNDAPAGADKTISIAKSAPYTFAAANFGFTDTNDSPANILLAVKIVDLPTAGTLTNNGAAVSAGQSILATDISAGKLVFTAVAGASGTGYASFTFQVQDNGGTANGGVDLDQSPNTITFDVADNTVLGLGDLVFTGYQATSVDKISFVLLKDVTAGTTITFNDNRWDGTALGTSEGTSVLTISKSFAAGTQFNYDASRTSGSKWAVATDITGLSDVTSGNFSLNASGDNMFAYYGTTAPSTGGSSAWIAAFATNNFQTAGVQPTRVTDLPSAFTLGDNAFSLGLTNDASDENGSETSPAPSLAGTTGRIRSIVYTVGNWTTYTTVGTQVPAGIAYTVTSTDAPDGVNKTVTIEQDASYTFVVADFGFSDANDTPANSLQSVQITTLPTAGSLTNNNVAVNAGDFISAASITSGLLQFTPAVGVSGSPYATFTFQVKDNGGTALGTLDLDPTPNTVTFNVTPPVPNDPPVNTVPGAQTVNEDTALAFTGGNTISVTDPNGNLSKTKLTVTHGTLTVSVAGGATISAGASGSATLTLSGTETQINAALATLSYQATLNFNGSDTLTVLSTDSAGSPQSDSDTIDITVTSVNDAPVGANKTVTTLQDTNYVFTVADFGFTDPNDNPANSLLAVKITTLPGTGTLKLGTVDVSSGQFITAADITSGLLKFIPVAGQSGTAYATFTFQVQDNGDTANGGVDLDPSPKTITVNVTAVNLNHAPAGTNKTVTINEDTTYTFATADFGFSDVNDSPANTLLAVKVTTLPGAGSLTNNGIAVSAGDFIPVADISGNKFKFTPVANANGTGYASFTFQVQDNGGTAGGGVDLDQSPNTITVNVTAVNDAPVANNSTFTTNEDTTLNGTVSFSDVDTGAGQLSVILEGEDGGASGSVTMSTNGSFIYVPRQNFNGVDHFSFTVFDGSLGSNTATVTINVTAVNDAPTFNLGTAPTVAEDAGPQTVANILTNPSAGPTDELTGGVNAQTLSLNVTNNNNTLFSSQPSINLSTGTLTYTPAANANGTATVTVTLTDSGSNTAPNVNFTTKTFTINVTAVNDAPVSQDQSITTNEDTAKSGTAVATDVDSVSLTYSKVAGPTHGSVTFNSDGTFTYTPNANYHGTDSFTFKANDGSVDSNTATVSITINSVNDAPFGTDHHVEALEDTTYTFTAADFPGGDLIDSDSLRAVKITTLPTAGTLLLNGNPVVAGDFVTVVQINASLLTFVPAPDANGSDDFSGTAYATFTFQVQDNGGTNFGGIDLDPTPNTLIINVQPVDDAPAGTDVSVTIDEDTVYTLKTSDFGFSDPRDNPAGNLAFVRITTLPTAGTLLLNGSPISTVIGVSVSQITGNQLTFVPGANAQGTPYGSFTFQVRDDGTTFNGGVNLDPTPNTFTFNVNGTNDAPLAADDDKTADEDVALVFNASDLVVNDTDVDGDSLTVTAVTATANTHGTVSLNAGVITYTPAANYNGPASFDYTVSDGHGGTDTGTVNITVNPVNDAPVAVDDSKSTNEDVALVFNASDLVVNDTDVESDSLTVTVVTATANTHGTVTLNAGVITYTPAADFNGSASFDYTVSDGHGGADTGTVNVTVNPVNDAPVAVDDSKSTDEDVALVFNASDLVVNDTDVDGDSLTVTAVTATANTHGTVALVAGVITYTPAADFNGSASFDYTVSDGHGGTDIGTVNVTVNPVNDAPVAVDDSKSTNEDTALVFNASDLVVNDTDVDGDSLTVTAVTVTANTHGTVALVAGVITYTPAADFNGSASFDYTVSDGHGGTDIGTVNVTVNPVNDAPVAVDDSKSTNEDVALVFNASDLVVNDTDVDGDSLTVTAVTATANTHGTVSLNAGVITYTPAANYNGPASFDYTVSDGHGGTDTGTVNVTVNAVNDAPVASNDSKTTDEDVALVFNAGDLVANDFDQDGDGLVVTAVAATANTHGTVTLDAGVITYTPAQDYNGSASFEYTVSDGHGGSATGTVNVTINPVNDAPVAVTDNRTTDEDVALVFNASELVANDTDVDGDSLTVTAVTQLAGTHGTVVLASGVITYTPAANYNGPANIGYTISDGHGGTATGSIHVIVSPVNDAPVAADGSLTTSESVAKDSTLVVTDVDNVTAELTISIVAGPSHGTVLITDAHTGAYTYTPAANYNGPDSFTFKANDGSLDSNIATVTITVTEVNSTPVASDGTLTTDEDIAANGTLIVEDADNTPSQLTITVVDGPTNGTLLITNIHTGAYTYTPNENYHGSDSFTFKANDGLLDSNIATVSITINSVNDAPVAVDDAKSTNEDTALVFNASDLVVNDTDVDVDSLTVTAVTATANTHGTVALVAGVVTYTPAANYNGSASFDYTVSDGHGGTDIGTVNVTVNPVNDAPVAVDDSLTTIAEDSGARTISFASLTANDTDVDNTNAQLTITAVSNPVGGTVSIQGTDVIFTPTLNFNGTAGFDYTLSDGALTDTGSVSFTITAVNDAPVAVDDAKSTNEDIALVFNASDLIVNDTDVDGDSLAVTTVTATANTHGTVELVAGVITYVPAADFNGSASFDYTVSDGHGGIDTGTVNVTVNPVNDAPVAVDDSKSTNEDTALVFNASDLVVNDTDVDGDSLTVSAVTATANTHGTVALVAGVITYTPAADYNGSASFDYTVSDGHGGTDTGTVNVTVNPVNDAPVAVDDSKSTNEDTALVFNASDLVVNDTDVDGDSLTVSEVTATANTHGTVALVAGVITYTPAADYNGSASFDYTVSDGHGGTDTGTVNITVNPVNDAPVAVDDTLANIAEDSGNRTISFASLTANDTDIDNTNAQLTITGVSNPVGGTVSIQGTNVIFTPTLNFNGTASFDYLLSDGSLTDVGSVSFNVTAVNDAPVAVDDSLTSIAEDSGDRTISFASLLANDFDVDNTNGQLTITAVSNAVGGTVTIQGTDVIFSPTLNFNGTASFDYTLSDGNLTDIGSVSFTITAVNDAPVLATNTGATVFRGDVFTIGSSKLQVTDVDNTAAQITYTVTAIPGGGTLKKSGTSLVNNGTFTQDDVNNNRITYVAPVSGSTDSFHFTVTDGSGGSIGDTTFNITLVGFVINEIMLNPNSNDSPNEYIELRGPANTTIPAGTYLVGIEGDASSLGDVQDVFDLSGKTFGSNGFLVLLQKANTYTPAVGSSVYTNSGSGAGWGNGATSSLGHLSDNNPSDIENPSASFLLIRTSTAPTLADDIDTVGGTQGDGTPDGAVYGGWTVLDSVAILDNSSAGDFGYAAINFANSSGGGASTTGTIVTLAATAGYIGRIGNSTGSTAADWIASDMDATTGSSPIFVPVNLIKDSSSLSNGAYAGAALNHLGAANNFTLVAPTDIALSSTSVDENVAVGTPVGTFSTTDPTPGDSFTYSLVSGTGSTNNASFTIANVSGVGTLKTNASLNFEVKNSYSIRVRTTDSTGITFDKVFTITVNNVNEAPVAVDDTLTSIAEDSGDRTISFTSLTANDTDVDTPNAQLTITGVSNAVGGTVSIQGSNLIFSPTLNFNGTASFDYTLSDGSLTDTGSVSFAISAVYDAPVAVDDSKATNEDVALVFSASDLVVNDTDVDGDSLTVTEVTATANTHGTVALVAGVITYTPAADFNGSASFDYTVSDGHGGTDTGTVNVTVNPVNDNPVAVADSKTTAEDTVLTFPASDLTANDTDVEGDSLTVTSVAATANTHGTVALVSGVVTYTPAANYNGPASFDYSISDGNGGTATGTVNVTVTAVNDNPVAVNDTKSTAEDTVLTFSASDLTANDTDVDGDSLTVTAVAATANTHGTVALVSGVVTYTPAANYNGPASFDYSISDSHGGTATGTVNVRSRR